MASLNLPRGVRNNNPLNLVHVKANKWQGLADPASDGRFCRFVSPQYGIRACAMNIIAYQDRYNVRTIAALVARWAPASENDVAAYIKIVVERSGFTANQRLDFTTYDHLQPVMRAMAFHECGMAPFHAPIWDEGLMMAGVLGTPKHELPAARPAPVRVPKSATKDKAVISPVIMTTATAAAQVTAQVESIWSTLARINPWAPHIVLGLLGLIAVAAGAVFFVDWLKARRAARAA